MDPPDIGRIDPLDMLIVIVIASSGVAGLGAGLVTVMSCSAQVLAPFGTYGTLELARQGAVRESTPEVSVRGTVGENTAEAKHAAEMNASCPFVALQPCTESIPFCAATVRWHGRDPNIAILEDNEVYRVSDVVGRGGSKWRIDAIRVLCNARYRGTLLRAALEAHSLYKGAPVRRGVEEHGPGWLEDTLAATAPTEAFKGVTGPSGITLGRTRELKATFVSLLRDRYEQGACEVAADTELVLHPRLGDTEIRSNARGKESNQELLRQVRRYIARFPSITGVVINVVLNFGPVPWKKRRNGIPIFTYTQEQEDAAVGWVSGFLEDLQEANINARVRSQPIADDDICFLVFSKHYMRRCMGGLPIGGYFPVFISDLRYLVWGQSYLCR